MWLPTRGSELRRVVANIDPGPRSRLLALLTKDFKGVIPADFMKDMRVVYQLSESEAAALLLAIAKGFARPSLSGFAVGAALRCKDGHFYLGCNLEFPGQPLFQSVHAEQSALALASIHAKDFDRLYVSEAPCGHCRQFLMEYGLPPDFPIAVSGHDLQTLSSLLPMAFGPADLGVQSRASAATSPNLRELDHFGKPSPSATCALRAAKKSHAPYSLAPCGAGLEMKDGHLIAGSYVESAAYNPSLGALQAALIQSNFLGYGSADIKAAALAYIPALDHLMPATAALSSLVNIEIEPILLRRGSDDYE